jgi:anhydro-N-acetylmuramic acid kinase
VIPASAEPEQIVAFDTGPANMLIDGLVAHFTSGRQRYDAGARLAQIGRSIPGLLDELMRDPYLRLAPPKSTGREYYGHAYVKKVLALGRRHCAKPRDLIRAVTIFTALSVVDALNRFVFPRTKIHQVIVSGGGARNPLILAQLSAALGAPASMASSSSASEGARYIVPLQSRGLGASAIEVVLSSRLGVPEDAKEAFAFALLAYETFHHRPSNLPSATGASGAGILGKICYALPG